MNVISKLVQTSNIIVYNSKVSISVIEEQLTKEEIAELGRILDKIKEYSMTKDRKDALDKKIKARYASREFVRSLK